MVLKNFLMRLQILSRIFGARYKRNCSICDLTYQIKLSLGNLLHPLKCKSIWRLSSSNPNNNLRILLKIQGTIFYRRHSFCHITTVGPRHQYMTRIFLFQQPNLKVKQFLLFFKKLIIPLSLIMIKGSIIRFLSLKRI